MPRVDFHVLSGAGPDARFRYACRMAEKAFDAGERVFIRTASDADSQKLDELLWTFSDGSFLPHEIAAATSPSHPRVAILIGTGEAPEGFRQVLINLDPTLPAVDSYQRIIEIVDDDAERKQLARERYRQYRERGCTLESHNV